MQRKDELLEELIKVIKKGGGTLTSLTGTFVGNITGNVLGNVTGNTTGTHTGDVVDGDPVAVDFDGAHGDHTLTASEKKSRMIVASNASQAANIIAPKEYRAPYIVKNGAGFAITVKGSTGTGIAIADGKYAMVTWDGTNYIRVTPDT
jgi:hypothetical protein